MKFFKFTALPLLAAVLAIPSFAQDNMEKSDFGRWYISPGLGYTKFEGDEVLKDGPYLTMRLGYDCNETWSLEGSFLYAWKLPERLGGYSYFGEDGVWREHDQRYSYSVRQGGDRDFDNTWMMQLYLDALFHFTRLDKIDPYLTFGAGVTLFGADISSDGAYRATVRGGGGIMYHLNDSWSLRADSRINLGGYNTEFSATFDVGFVYRFSA